MRKDLDGVIAIVGLSGRFPGARNVEELWRSVRDGVDLVRLFTDEELRALGVSPALLADPTYIKAAAQPPDLDKFDAGFFGINHREAEILDPQQRVFLETCWEALEDAGYDPDTLGTTVTGVFGGQTTSTYLLFNLLPSIAGTTADTMDPLQLLVGNAGDSLATRVSYKLNLKGPSYTVQSACSTSAVAVHTACQSLLNGECDLALAGGVSINVHLLTGYRATEGSVFAKGGKCRAFDAGAEGILFGGGAGVVVLKRAEDALRDRDNIHALILGSAVNNDGALKVGYTAPSVDGQAEVIAEAWAAAGVEMESASYIEAHGTGTRLGDPIEIQALTKAFRPTTAKLEKKQLIPLGSVKTNIGHLDVAAGIAGLIKTVMALKHRQIPPSLHFQEPNSEIDFASSPVFVNTELRPWEGFERRAGVSSFGFGGTNVHLVLEEAPELPATHSQRERFFLPLSARSEPALEQACQRLADWLEDHPELDLADVEHTLRVGRRTFEHRRVVECRTREEAIEALREGRRSDSAMPEPIEGRRVSLPTYPFERRRYWIAAAGGIDAPGIAVAEAAICSVPARPERSFHPRPSLFNPYEPPRDEHEEKVALIWQEVLGVSPVGAHDDFFQLGGHSLLAPQILGRVRDVFEVDFPLQQIFSFPTPAELAEAILFLQEDQGPPPIPISPLRETGGPYPLSFSQERLWFIDRLEPGNPIYNEPRAARILGQLDVAALEASLREILRRQEALRTTFQEVDGAAVQMISPVVSLRLPVLDLSALPESVRQQEAERLAGEEARRSFDLAQGPLLRSILLRLTGSEHVALFTVHHIASDGWSLDLLVGELTALYGALSQGLPSPLPELPIQYVDFADWQRQHLQGEVLEQHLAYWREELAGAPSGLDLPTDRPRPPVPSYRGGLETHAFPGLIAAVDELARREGASRFMTLLAAFQALLHRLSGQSDLLAGSPVANRTRPETEGLVGFFVNLLVLRARFADGLSFRELLRQARDTCLRAYEHQDLPFEKLVEGVGAERDLSRTPLFQVLFLLQNPPLESVELPGLTLAAREVHAGTARFELTLLALESGGELFAAMEYSSDLFEAETARRWLGHLGVLLQAALADPDARLADLPLLTEPEWHQLASWNETAVAYPEATLIELIEAQVERTPEAPAVVFEGEALTYRELDERAAALAGYLASIGVGPETLVGICAERSLEMVVGLVGILKAGGAYVPLDPAYPADRLTFMLEDSAVPVLLTQSHLVDRLPAHEAKTILLEHVPPPREGEGWLRGEARRGASRVTSDFAAYAIFTSGSTGRPKGAINTHRGIVNRLLWMQQQYGLTPGDRVLQKTPFSFDVSVWEFFWPLIVGARLVVARPGGHQDPAYLVDTIVEEGVTTLHFVPSMLQVFVEQPGVERCTSVRKVMASGEALPAGLSNRFFARLPEGAELHNLYGPTEAAVDVTWHACRPGEARVPIGRPVANTRIHVLDRESNPVPVGVAGELFIGGVQVARGYLHRPDLTADRFVPDPFGDAGMRLYRTGDLARWLPDGEVEYLGRIDHQVKVRGFRIELGEIEAALARHPEVREAVVLARGEGGEKALVAYVVTGAESRSPSPGEGVREERERGPGGEGLRVFLRESLPEHMVPSAFVFLEAMPLSPNGKADRKALARIEPERPASESEAPRTPVEERLAGIWRDLLGVERVGVSDSFFDLGGHSLLGTRVISRVRDAFGVELPLRALFEAPTLAELAARITGTPLETADTVVLARRDLRGGLPLSFAQERLWLLDRLDPGNPAYNVPAVLRLRGPVDRLALERSFGEIVRRHAALRTTFHEIGEAPVQVVSAFEGWSLPLVDLHGLLGEDREREARRLALAESLLPFDLARGPLLRTTLMRLSNQEWMLLVDMHHIVSDGWSIGLLLSEAAELYGAFLEGRAPRLPDLPLQYADYAVWQRGWLTDERLRKQIDWWREELAGAATVLELPTDRPRPPVRSSRGAREWMEIGEDLTRDLRTLAHAEGATPFMVLMAAFQALLHRYSGQSDVLVGSPIANRNRTEFEGLIGFFVNTLVLRGRFEPSSLDFRELLARTRSTVLAAYAHQDLPFERLVEELKVPRSLSHTPLFQAMLALQNAPMGELRLPNLELVPVHEIAATAKLDLNAEISEGERGVAGTLEYSTDLFDASTIRRMIEHFRSLLGGAIAHPESRIAELPLLTESERYQLLALWNDTAVEYPETTLTALIEAQVESTPDAPAVVFEGESLTYRQLDEKAGALAGHLASLGVGPETLVGICAERSLEMVVGLVGILKAGAAYVPLDPAYPADRLSFMLEDSAVPVLLTQSHLLDRIPPHSARVILLEQVPPSRRGASRVTPDFAAYAIFTSGSTGRPKGAINTHRGIVNRILWMQQQYGLTPEDRVLQKTPFSFDVSVWEFFWPLIVGARLVVARPGGHQDPAYLVDTIVREGITTLHFVPSMLQVFVEQPGVEQCASLRKVMASGEALPADLSGRFFARLPEGTELHNLYGPTEAAVDVTYHACQPGEERVPIGRPVANTRIHILDPDDNPVPVGVAGELLIGGVQVARGYLHRPDLTADRFVPDPYGQSGSRFYRTGDLARWLPSGEVEYLGRIDHQVKVRGFRIELGEIEESLARHPEVREAVVLARGEGGEKVLVAYVVPDVSADLKEFLRESLPEHMVPSAFVFLESMPLSPNGKADRKALARIEPERRASGSTLPGTPTEELLAGIWCDLLGVERVGVEDNFFELGGHSLMGTRVVSRVLDTFGVELPLRTLFEAPTLGSLAARVEAERAGEVHAPPVRLPRTEELPLSFSQERLWFLEQLEPGGSVYNIPVGLFLDGRLDVAALAGAFRGVVRRHETLRTTFPALSSASHPVQRIDPDSEQPLPVIDLGALPEPRKDAELRRLAAEDAARPFDLVRGPVFRTTLVRLADERHACLLNLHHIVGDAWSLGVLIRDMAALYSGTPLPELPLQYADFSVWQRDWLRGEILESQLAWWREALAGAPAVLELPSDRPRPPVHSSRGGRVPMEVPTGLAAALRTLSRREGATLFMTVLAAFQALLHRLTGQEDLLVGTPVAGRNRTELEGLIGFFVNSLVLRGRPASRLPFRHLLAQARTTALGAFARQDLPFEKLVEELGVERNLAHHPLFQVMLSVQNTPTGAPELPGLALSTLEVEGTTAKFDLTLTLSEVGEDGLEGTLEYSADLFDPATARRLLRHFCTLLEGVASEPGAALADLPLLTRAELDQILVEWNDHRSDYPAQACVHELFAEQVERAPEAVAAVFGEETCSYRELDARANRLANHLRELGAGPGAPVAIYLERSLDMVVATLAVLKAGSTYVPLDTSYPEERLAFMLEDAGAPVLVTRERWLGLFPETVRTVCLDRDAALLERKSSPAPSVRTAPEALAYVIYTSGSTGKPKGVAVPHQAIVRLVRNTNYIRIRPDDVIAQASNTSFDAATFEIWGALLNGACMVGVSKETMLSPRELAAQIRRDGITTLFLTTALFNQVMGEAPDAFQPLRTLLFGGEAVDPARVRQCLQSGPPERLLHVYGPTESTTYASWHRVEDVPPTATTVPIGQPLGNTTLVVLDPELNLVPVGVTGELYIGGGGLAWGYLNRPELTAERFVPDPFATQGERLYRTGDLVRRRAADGAVEFLGRADFQVKVRGFRIELGEIEAALVAHPGVRDAAVLVLGEGSDKRLVAYVAGTAAPDLRSHLADRLPSFMIPSGWVFLESLPLNPNGKVDRSALARIEPETPEITEAATDGHVAPRTPVEEMLAGAWAELLNLGAGARVGIHDDFFDLGGHSLMATRLVSRLRELFAVDLPLRAVFEAPTLSEMAQRIERAQEETLGVALTPPPILPASAEARGSWPPLSFAQERLWFLDRLEPGTAFYSVPVVLRIAGRFGETDVAALHAAIQGIVRRHEALRTTFDQRDGTPFQVVAPDLRIPLPVIDLSGLPEERREPEAARRLKEEVVRPFDIAAGPLLRSLLLRLDGQEWRAFFNLHHIVADGWSLGVLVRELGALYEASTELPVLPVQYVDFAIWQRAWIEGEVLEAHIAYWKERLRNARTVLDLPTDRPRPPVQTFRGATRPVILPGDLSAGLAALGRKQGVTLFMTLLAAFQTLLFRYTRQEDILVGSPVAGRSRREIEGLIGLFVNTVVLRGELAGPRGLGEPTFGELLEATRATALGAFAHQELPFERLVDELKVQRSMARHPVFQVVLALQNTPAEELRLPGLTLETVETEGGTSKVDLLLSLSEMTGTLQGIWEYSTDLFDADTIDRMTGHLRTLLEGAVADPGSPLSDLPLLTGAERHQALAEWNDTAGVLAGLASLCFHEVFAATVARVPDKIAVVFGSQRLTYAALAARAERLAAHLRSLGIGPESLVGICADEGIERVIAVLGVFRAGGAYLPIDPSHPKDRTAWMMQDAQVRVLLTQESLLAVLPETEAEIVTLDGLLEEEREAVPVAPAPPAGTLPDNLAYVIYTSGSTGRPNGVLVRHGSAVHLIGQAVRQFGVDEESRVLQSVSFSFDASVLETWTAFAAGATLCVSRREVRMSGTALADMIRREGITHAVLTPSVLGGLPREAFPSLRTISVGGDSCPGELATRWSPPQRSSRLFNCYGPTETTIYAVAKECRGTFRKEPPIGRPLGNIRAYVVDPTGRPVPVGVPGELWLGGEGVARGYLNRPGLTAERFLPDPFATSVEDGGARLYRTGDLVRTLPEGDIEFLGRVDRQVKVRGLRMELGEIEAALGQHALVTECAVLAVGQGADKRLVGFVVARSARPGGDDTALGTRDLITQLREHLRQTLPEYMVPASFLFLETMPLTPVGKVDRRVLSQMDLAFDWEVERVEARDVLELELARLWGEVLGIPRIGVRDNFFELGGHSLLAVRLVEQVQQRFGRDLPLAVLFQGGTVEEMAALLRDDSGVSSGAPFCLVPIHPEGKARPFFCVHPAGGDVLCFASLARSLGPDQPFYGLQSRGMAGDGEPLTRIEEMAALYLEEVRTVQPSGPYLLGGWSLGALIAFEMARQLRSAGEEVALLAVLDSAPDIPGAGIEVEEDHVTALLEIAQYVERLWGKDVGLVREDLEGLDSENGLELLLERLRAADFLPPGAGVGQLRRILKVYQANTLAARRYVPGRYPDRVTLFRAADVPEGVGPQSSDLGWGRVSGERVEVHVIPGDHITMLAEPNVHELARRLRTALEGACEPAGVV